MALARWPPRLPGKFADRRAAHHPGGRAIAGENRAIAGENRGIAGLANRQCHRIPVGHLDEPVNIEAMVQHTTLSRRSFFRVFRKMTGCSHLEYRTRLKLKMAADLLKTTDLSVKEIAIRCNFYDANYLCRLFRQSLGVSPRAFHRRR